MIPAKYWSPTKKLMVLGAMAGGKTVEATALGNPLTFITDKAKPLKSLLIPFTPQQEGSGDPSPENIRPILPWNGLTVFGGGKNLLPNTASSKTANGVTFTVNSDGTISVSGTATGYADLTIGKSEVPNKGKIVLSGLEEAVKIRWSQIRILDANDNVLGDFYGQATTRPYVINMDDYPTAKYVQIGIKREDNNVAVSGTVKPMLEVGETATAYEPYIPITDTDIVFTSPVYGGTLDVVSGVLTVEWAKYSAKWSEWETGDVFQNVTRKTLSLPQGAGYLQRLEGNSITNVTNVYLNRNSSDTIHYYVNTRGNVFYVFLPNETDGDIVVEICGKLIEPYEIQLTPHQLTSLVGDNTIWSDANGQMTAVYLKKG